MLVDNAVNGDSRVQKAARSAADAGWRVVLLGRSMDRKPHTWQLGAAEVRLLPFRNTLEKRRHEYRRRWLLAPFAYPPTGIAAHRTQSVKAWQTDLRTRRDLLRIAARSGHGGLALSIKRQWLTGQRILAALARRWVSFRSRQLDLGRRLRSRLNTPSDYLYTKFWQLLRGDRAWRRLEPGLWDYEFAYGKAIDDLAPDLIHANDFRMIGVGARAVIRARVAGREVKLVWDAHEFLPGTRPWKDNKRWSPAHQAHEREYAPYADAAITVSPALADLLQRHHDLAERPTVVLNAPALDHGPDKDAEPVPDLRQLCGIGAEVPLLVYSGLAAKKRDLHVMVESLPKLDGVHVAFVVHSPTGPYLQELLERAKELGVVDRVHALSYVPYWQVVPFLSAADVGVVPIQHWPNHEIALITKFFEYSHARLPVVVSDVRTMAETVRATGQGEVFRAEDVDDFVRATRAVLADPGRYRSAYDKPGLLEDWTWEAQAKVLDAVYGKLLPDRPAATATRPVAVPAAATADIAAQAADVVT